MERLLAGQWSDVPGHEDVGRLTLRMPVEAAMERPLHEVPPARPPPVPGGAFAYVASDHGWTMTGMVNCVAVDRRPVLRAAVDSLLA